MTQHQTESSLEELIGKIDALDAKRTKGPWVQHDTFGYNDTEICGVQITQVIARVRDGDFDSRFIVTLENAWPALRAELSRLREALADQEEQLAFRQPSAVERDMQEVMRINNELLARAEAAEAKLSTIREW